ncbi:MAG: Pr6Pr family membrane protein [Candidatus Hodarchaeota archaeon]
MKNFTLSTKNLLLYRIIFTGLSWFTIITSWIIGSITSGDPFSWLVGFKYYTMQTNLMVTIWFTLAIVWYNKPESLAKISGPIKGAFTFYISTTFVFFAILLQIFYLPTGWAAFSNLILHYITPIAFITDWVLTENNVKYEWKYLPYWTIYPIGYLIFALILGTFTGDYLYPFLDISTRGPIRYLIIICFLLGVGIALACLYIAINRKRIKD